MRRNPVNALRRVWLQPAGELPRNEEALQPLEALVLPKRWARDAMQAGLNAVLTQMQVLLGLLPQHTSRILLPHKRGL